MIDLYDNPIQVDVDRANFFKTGGLGVASTSAVIMSYS